jgi:purine-nucleoside phosphorylase
VSDDRLAAAAEAVLARCGEPPRVGIVLGSGLGGLADEVSSAIVVPYAQIPHHPLPTVAGHAGELVMGVLAGTPVALWRGRVHFYEGRPLAEVVFPIRLMRRMGVEAAILTNAAGGLAPELKPGDLLLIEDHVNLPALAGHNPLRGEPEGASGPPFVALTAAYDPELLALATDAASEVGVSVRRGVYAMVGGPSYETPAEARLLRLLGADAVGMSTAPEVIAAAQVGLRVLAVSTITNLVATAPGLPGANHLEVLAVAELAKARLSALLRGILSRMGARSGS